MVGISNYLLARPNPAQRLLRTTGAHRRFPVSSGKMAAKQVRWSLKTVLLRDVCSFTEAFVQIMASRVAEFFCGVG
jgi:hypothetical protein